MGFPLWIVQIEKLKASGEEEGDLPFSIIFHFSFSIVVRQRLRITYGQELESRLARTGITIVKNN
jgi:hypothetical protein